MITNKQIALVEQLVDFYESNGENPILKKTHETLVANLKYSSEVSKVMEEQLDGFKEREKLRNEKEMNGVKPMDEYDPDAKDILYSILDYVIKILKDSDLNKYTINASVEYLDKEQRKVWSSKDPFETLLIMDEMFKYERLYAVNSWIKINEERLTFWKEIVKTAANHSDVPHMVADEALKSMDYNFKIQQDG